MGLSPGHAVALAHGVERPENEFGEVEVGEIVAVTAVGDVAVFFVGAGTFLYDPDDLVEVTQANGEQS